MNKVSVSVIVPVYAGQDYILKLVKKVEEVKSSWNTNEYPLELIELIFVDDDSRDRSRDFLKEVSDLSWISVLYLAKNYGQHAATVAGISYSSGDWVVTLDEDLQHDPSEILEMLRRGVGDSSDIIYAKSAEPVHQSFFRDLSSKYYKIIIKKLTGNDNVVNFNSFRLLRGSTARSAAAVSGHESYYDIVLSWFSNKVTVYETVLHDQRYAETGTSGYNLRSLLSHARRMLLTSDARLLRGASYLGLLSLIVSCIFAVYFVLRKIYFPETISIDGWASQFVTTLAISSVLLVILGTIAEYISILVLESNGKPTYSIVNKDQDKVLKQFFEGSDSAPTD